MAKQNGPVKLIGSVGDITCYKSKVCIVNRQSAIANLQFLFPNVSLYSRERSQGSRLWPIVWTHFSLFPILQRLL
jgi:hypothetical protein